MEIWNKLIPSESFFSSFYIDSIVSDSEGLFITLKNDSIGESIKVIFDGSMFSNRTTQKNSFSKTIESLDETFCKSWSFFKVENSDYLEWLKEQSYGIYENEREDYKMKHYVLIGSNLVFEVLTPGYPEISIKNSKLD